MKKKNLARSAMAIAAAALAYVGATAYTGHRFQQMYEARLDTLEKDMPLLQLAGRHVERSLFSSTFRTRIGFGCSLGLGTSDAPFTVEFTDHVRHGPLPGLRGFGAASIDTTIVLPPSAPAGLRAYVEGLERGAIRTAVSYGGGYNTALRLPAGEAAGSFGKLGWAKVTLDASGDPDGSSAMRVNATLPEVTLQGTGDYRANAKLSNLRMSSETHGAGGSLWMRPGTSAIDIDDVELGAQLGDSTMTAQLKRMKYKSELTREQELLGGTATISADAVLQFGSDGKPLVFDQIEVLESFKRLHAPTPERLAAASSAGLPGCQAGQAAQDAADDDETAKSARLQAQTQDLLLQLLQLLPHSPEFALDKFAFGYEGQRGELSYSVGIRDFVLGKDETLASAQPRLIKAAKVQASLKLPAAWIDKFAEGAGQAAGANDRAAQAQGMLDLAIGKGLVVRTGDVIAADFVFEHGAVTVNGKKLGGAQ